MQILRRNEIDTRIDKDNAVPRELYRCEFTKWELSNTAKLLLFKSVFVPILTYGHESCVMTERVLAQIQAAEMGLCEKLTALHFAKKYAAVKFERPELLLQIHRSQLRWFVHVTRMLQPRRGSRG